MSRREELSGVRKLGLDVEPRVVKVFSSRGFPARHSEPQEDLSGWDVEINLYGYLVRIDLTISRARLREKNGSDQVRNGSKIAAWVNPRWSEEEIFYEILRQVIYSLPDRIKQNLLRELTT